MTGDRINRTIVQPAADNGRDGRAYRWLYIGIVMVALGLGFLAYQYLTQSQQIGALVESGNSAAGDARQLADQVTRLGGVPVVTPPAQGERGPVGAQGIPGRPGVDGTNGTSGINGVGGTQGVQGTSGANGTDGLDGAAGKDGADGKDGANGADGKDGAAGAAGQPPSGWTSTYPDGSVETCSRAAGFDPAAPQYRCTVKSPYPSSPPVTSSSAVLPNGRKR